ncbi:MAG: hypothetical protein SVR94_08800 [Pseudomonadota bacterium]|nr:hypothetical protein [Pseudomonadota bacterium]
MFKYLWIITLFWLSAVEAHNIKLFATVQGQTIEGYVYIPGGGRLAHAPIEIWTPAGKHLGQTRTDAEGEFHYPIKQLTDHLFILETDDGHRAQYTVKVHAEPLHPQTASIESSCLQVSTIEDVLSRQIRPLREQLAHYQQKIWLHDILGGIGYIVGIMGLLYYLNQRIKK